jgi:O-antigen/teichoic acid export membrane protein
MKAQYRDILKHSGVYGIGQLLSRLASVIMLPVYTRFLHPADYGIIAIVDLTTGILALLIGGGMTSAASRYHFEAETPEQQRTVWWTSVIVVTVLSTSIVIPGLLVRPVLANLMLGSGETRGGVFVALMLFTLWFATIGYVCDQYMRIRKWSWLTVGVALGGLACNLALNVYFVAVKHAGVTGLLTGNLISALLIAAVRFAIMARACGRPHFRWSLAEQLVRFGSPMVVAGFLALVMHEADRYLLRLTRDLGQVGIYSLAYAVGQGLNGMFLIPFAAIWGVVVYEIAKQPDFKHAYAQIFEYYVYVLLLFLFAVSLFVRPLMAIFLPAEYQAAAPIIPIVCLAFVFFSLHEHFRVPALLAKKTVSMLLAFTTGAIVNIGLNLLVLPRYGATGAAWTSVTTYAIFSAVGLARYRQIDRYEYPLMRCGFVLLAMIASYVACQYVYGAGLAPMWSLIVPAGVWTVWAVALLRPIVKRQLLRQALATPM